MANVTFLSVKTVVWVPQAVSAAGTGNICSTVFEGHEKRGHHNYPGDSLFTDFGQAGMPFVIRDKKIDDECGIRLDIYSGAVSYHDYHYDADLRRQIEIGINQVFLQFVSDCLDRRFFGHHRTSQVDVVIVSASAGVHPRNGPFSQLSVRRFT